MKTLMTLILALLIPAAIFEVPEVLSAALPDGQERGQLRQILVEYEDGSLATVNLQAGESVREEIFKLSQKPQVITAEPNFTYKKAAHQYSPISDYYYPNQWYLKRIEAAEAWDKQSSAEDIVVAVLDSGVMIDHPDLKENIWNNRDELHNGRDSDGNGYVDDLYGYDFVVDVGDPTPKFDDGFTENGIVHGTLVAGVLGARGNNRSGIAGVAHKLQIMPLRVLDEQGVATADRVVKAIDYAIANGANIINMSFIGEGKSQTLERAIRRAYDAGLIVVAAGGNEYSQGRGPNLDEKPMYPVCHDGKNGENLVLGVAATDPLDNKALFSGYGKCIDISAPGMSIFSTTVYAPEYKWQGYHFNEYYDGYWSGTSLAVPMVSGTLALIEQANPSLKPREVVKILLSNTDNINDKNISYYNRLGTGRLNSAKAVSTAVSVKKEIRQNLLLYNYMPAGVIKISSPQGIAQHEFIAWPTETRLSVAAGNIDGQAGQEIIAARADSGDSLIKIFDQTGSLIKSFYAFSDYQGGVNLAAGDINNDGTDEIVVGAGAGHSPYVRVFSGSGELLQEFFAYAPSFGGGVNLAVGDTNNNGVAEIVAAPHSKGGPHIRVFNGDGRLLSQFFAFDKRVRSGYGLAVASVYSSIGEEPRIVVTAGRGMSPYAMKFDKDGRGRRKFAVYNLGFLGGLNVDAADLDNDGKADLMFAPGQGGASHIRIYNSSGYLGTSFYAGKEEWTHGAAVKAISVNF